jgi:hypothetical protein
MARMLLQRRVVPFQEATLNKGLHDVASSIRTVESDGCDCMVSLALLFLLWSLVGCFRLKDSPAR